jgi:hypothetical protein
VNKKRNFGCHKMCRTSGIGGRLLASQAELCSVNLVIVSLTSSLYPSFIRKEVTVIKRES